MKFHTRRLLSLLLMLSLFVSLLSVGAYAVDVPEITCELGTALDYTIPLEGDDSAAGFEIVGGSLPSGLTVELKEGAVKLVGTPDAGGDYSCTIKITGASGAEAEYVLTIKIIDPTLEPTPSPIPVPAPSITKDPTDGTVLEGEYAIFIARADYADKIEWRFVNPKNDDSVNARDVGSRFPGTHCEGYDEETLVVYNIRYEMNGWEAVCKFIGDGGSAFSEGARITVNKNGPLPPSITRDPFVTSDSDTLSVTANDPNNGVLNYQWYSSADNSNANDDGKDVKIAGATSATYVPPETPGTVYYYCAVWSTVDGQKSIEAKSRVAAVTHAIQPTPEPTPAPTPEPTPPPPEPSAEPSALSGRSSSRFLLILMGVLILALIAAAVSLVIISRKERELGEEDEDEEEEKRLRSEEASRVFKAAPAKVPAPPAVPVAAAVPDEPAAETAVSDAEAKIDPEGFVLDGWYCVKCGSFNRGHNCTACGAEKPKEAIQYVCDRCGWTNPDPEHPPRFCPDCGAPYAAADDDR